LSNTIQITFLCCSAKC